MDPPALNGYLLKYNGDNAGMNHDALEARMEAIMNGTPATEQPKQPTPQPAINKRLIAALMLGTALISALITGFFRPASVPPSALTDVVETIEAEDADQRESKIDVFFFNIGVGRYRK